MNIYRKLFHLDRTLVSDQNELALSLISKELPIKIHRVKSGTQCFDWKVPKKWNPIKGVLKDDSGKVVLDIKDSILHLLNYSRSFNGKISMEELKDHLFYDIDNPDAIPYRTSYYSDNWGFCISYNQFKELKSCMYEVDIKVEETIGKLLIGEAKLEGQNKKEVILTSYYCHPKQANDGLSGVVLLIKLYNLMKNQKLNYTYRFFFWPETIGCISAIAKGIVKPENTEYALVSTTVGIPGPIQYKKTFLGSHSLDNIIEKKSYINTKAFKPTGSDERQLSSPNVKIPTGVLTTKPYERYKEYHTSDDNLDLVDIETINQMAKEYYDIVIEYDSYKKYKLNAKACEPFLTKYNSYREIGIPGNSFAEEARNWVLYFCDGKNNISDISKKTNIEEEVIANLLEILIKKGVVYEGVC